MTPIPSSLRIAFASGVAFMLALASACGDDTDGAGGHSSSDGGSTGSDAPTSTTGVGNSSVSAGSTHASASASVANSSSSGGGGAPPDTSNPAHVDLAGGDWLDVGGVTVYADVAAMTSDELGNLFVAGSFCGNLDWVVTTLTVDCTDGGSYLLKLDPTGHEIWSHAVPPTSRPQALRLDDTGHLFVGGFVDGHADLGGTVLDGLGPFVAELDGDDGSGIMSAIVTGAGSLTFDAAGIAIDPISSDVLLAGQLGSNTFLARVDGTGQTIWSKTAGDGEVQGLTDVAISAGGAIAIAGRYNGNIDLGAGPLPFNDPSIGSPWGFVAFVDGLGLPVATHTLQASVNLVPSGKLAFDADGNLYWSGTYSEASTEDIVLDHNSAYGPAAYVIKLDPTGAIAWAQGFSGSTFHSPTGGPITVDAAGHILATGSFLNDMPGCGTGLSVPLAHTGAYLMALEADGSCDSLTLLADATDSIDPFAIAPLPGHVAVAGSFKLDTTLGGSVYETQHQRFSAYSRPFIITATP